MILDLIENHARYPFGPAWIAAFDFLKTVPPAIEPGKYPIQGDNLFIGVDCYDTKPRENAKLETHRKYVDIQLLLSGSERLEVFQKRELIVSEPYLPEKDAEFYQIPADPRTTITLEPGQFIVFFPDDAHMPCLMSGQSSRPVKKVVVKLAANLLLNRAIEHLNQKF